MAEFRPRVVFIHNLLASVSKTTKKVVAHLAQCMSVNTKTTTYGLSHNILLSRRLRMKFFRVIIIIASTRVSLQIDDIIGSHVYTAA
jgi:hypothetical protein